MMIKKSVKRYMALIIVAAMILSLSTDVSAEDLSQNSDSDINQLTAGVETDIYQVVMPTNTDGIFDFILDPQGLINETNGALHGGKNFEKDCTVFFRRSDGKVKEDYSCKSDSVTITNKSTMPVEVSLDVKIDPNSLEGIKMTEDSKFKKDKSASLYLAVVDGKEEIPVGKDGVTICKNIDAAPDGAYGYDYDVGKEEYTYGLRKNIDNITFDEYSFQITGAANKKGDWTEIGDSIPKIVVTWKVKPKENTKLRKDAILKEDKMSDTLESIPEKPEESENQDEYEAPENRETEEQQMIPTKDETNGEPPVPNEDASKDGDVPTADENENTDEDLNNIAE